MPKVLNHYEVNLQTMVILPRNTAQGVCSVVKEANDEFLVLQPPFSIIQQSCCFFGSSYSGRVSGTKSLTGITHKPPIAISPENNIFFFPTVAASNDNCIWIAHSYVKGVLRKARGEVLVQFNSGVEMSFKISLGSFENQLLRAAQLKSAYAQREPNTYQAYTYAHEDEVHHYIEKKYQQKK